jgi:3D (Asp-Asp-Asp) domain-containing protein
VSGEKIRLRLGALAVLAGALTAVVLPTAQGADSAKRLRQQAAQLRQQNAGLATRSRGAVVSLYALDAQLARARSEVGSLENQAAELALARAEAHRRLHLARHDLRGAQTRLAIRIRAVYEDGGDDPLAVVLGATSVDAAITGIESLQRIAGQDRNTIEQIRDARARLLRLTAVVAANERELARLINSARGAVAASAEARRERLAFIAELASKRQLNTRQIASLESQAHAALKKAQAIAVQQATAPAPTARPTGRPAPEAATAQPGARTLTVVATGYSLFGRTATGTPVGWGVVAVDPGLIPLGTRISIPGYGTGVAADTGPGVRGAMIDLWFPSAAQAAAWGRRTVTITVG